MTAIELATFRAKPDHGDAMADGLRTAAGVIAEADGCLGATAMRCIERPDEFILRAEWTAVEKHFEFRDSADFPRYRAHFGDHLEELVGFAHYNEL
jgi:quinol monooxygenase YgiN